MQRLGVYLIFFAIGSAILSQTNYQFRILFWMEEMGNGAWVVRAIMVAIGAFMLLGGRMTRAQSQPGRISVPAPRPNPHAVHQAAQHEPPRPQMRIAVPQPQPQQTVAQPQPPAAGSVVEF